MKTITSITDNNKKVIISLLKSQKP